MHGASTVAGEHLGFWIRKGKGKKGLNLLPVAQIFAIVVSMAHHENSAVFDGCGWGMGWWPRAGLACWPQPENFCWAWAWGSIPPTFPTACTGRSITPGINSGSHWGCRTSWGQLSANDNRTSVLNATGHLLVSRGTDPTFWSGKACFFSLFLGDEIKIFLV